MKNIIRNKFIISTLVLFTGVFGFVAVVNATGATLNSYNDCAYLAMNIHPYDSNTSYSSINNGIKCWINNNDVYDGDIFNIRINFQNMGTTSVTDARVFIEPEYNTNNGDGVTTDSSVSYTVMIGTPSDRDKYARDTITASMRNMDEVEITFVNSAKRLRTTQGPYNQSSFQEMGTPDSFFNGTGFSLGSVAPLGQNNWAGEIVVAFSAEGSDVQTLDPVVNIYADGQGGSIDLPNNDTSVVLTWNVNNDVDEDSCVITSSPSVGQGQWTITGRNSLTVSNLPLDDSIRFTLDCDDTAGDPAPTDSVTVVTQTSGGTSCNPAITSFYTDPTDLYEQYGDDEVTFYWDTNESGSCNLTCRVAYTINDNYYTTPDRTGATNASYTIQNVNDDVRDIELNCWEAQNPSNDTYDSAPDVDYHPYNPGNSCNPTIYSFDANPDELYEEDGDDEIRFTWDTNESSSCNLSCTVYWKTDGYSRNSGSISDNTDASFEISGIDDDVEDIELRCYEVYNLSNDTTESIGDINYHKEGDDDDFEIETLTPGDDDGDDRITLRGENEGADKVDVWFVLSDDRDTSPECGEGSQSSTNDWYISVSGDVDDGEKFEKTVYNLTRGNYYYRACGEKSGDIEEGSVEKFQVGTFVPPTLPPAPGPNSPINVPAVVTLGTENINQTGATLFGGYNANTCQDFRTVMRLGSSSSNLNISTEYVTRGNTYGVHQVRVRNLTPRTTYYYQMMGVGCGEVVYGDIRSFRTTGSLVTPTPVTPTPVTPEIVTVEGGDSCLDLDITNNREGTFRGEILAYEVEWENNCESELHDGYLVIELPTELELVSTSMGQYSGKTENSLLVQVGNLRIGERDDMTFSARVKSLAPDGGLVFVSATASFNGNDNDINNDRDDDFDVISVTAYEVDPIFSAATGLTASAFGSGFFFRSIWGWLMLLILLGLAILAARYFYLAGARRDRNGNGYYGYYQPQMPSGTPVYAQIPVAPMGYHPMAPLQNYHQVPVANQPVGYQHMAPAPATLPTDEGSNQGQPLNDNYTPYRPEPYDPIQDPHRNG